MDDLRTGARRAPRLDETVDLEKANESADTASALLSMFQAPAASGFLLTQKLALESTRFWARRMRAYADQFEALSRCTSANQFVEVNTKFIERLREDYAQETAAVSDIVILPAAQRSLSETREQPGA